MHGLLLKLVDSRHVVRFNERAIMARTCEFVAAGSDVVVALAIRRCCELFEELQVRKRRGIDGCCFMSFSYDRFVACTSSFANVHLRSSGAARVRENNSKRVPASFMENV